MLEPDSVLGWRNRPGTYAYPSYVRGAPEVRVTIGPDGTRATASAPVARGDVVDLLGCSFTFGWALSDGRTLAWNLQQALPDLEIHNHGTPAYGTLQSLMALEALLAAGRVPRLVVYDLAELHARRNVAAAQWLRTWPPRGPAATSAFPTRRWRMAGSCAIHPRRSRSSPWPTRRPSSGSDRTRSSAGGREAGPGSVAR